MRYPFHTALVITALALTGCASSPVTLVVLPSPPSAARTADENVGPSILVRRASVPGYLDSFLIVLGRADGALVVSSSAEWAERLSDAVTRILRDALSQRLGAERVLIARDGRIPDADLRVEFLSLDPAGGTLNLDARWFFTCAVRAQSSGGRTHVEVPLARATPGAVAHATTTALTRFADELATHVPCAAQSPRDVSRNRGRAS
ncbi:MAG: PqiC family protein [Burkholderiales bacterium]